MTALDMLKIGIVALVFIVVGKVIFVTWLKIPGLKDVFAAA
jgi:hypothetical protein